MKINYLIFIYFLLLSSMPVFAQNQPANPNQAVSLENDFRKLLVDGNLNRASTMMMRGFDNRTKNYRGTPYFFDEWYVTDIHLKDGYKFGGIFAKLDIFKEQELMVLRKDKGDSILVDDATVAYFIMQHPETGTKHIFKRYEVGSSKGERFCEVLQEGKYTAIVFQTKSIIPADVGNSQSSGRDYDKFVSNTEFFIITPENEVVKLKKSKKGLLQILNQYEKEFEAYLAKNKLDFDKKETLAAAVAFYNSLLEK
jgi:hypothetical protein